MREALLLDFGKHTTSKACFYIITKIPSRTNKNVLNTCKSAVNSFELVPENSIPANVQLFSTISIELLKKAINTCTIAVI